MPDMAALGALLTSLSTAIDITKTMKGVHDQAIIQGKVMDLTSEIVSVQQHAIEAQAERMNLLNEIHHLRDKVAELESWNAEKQRYELAEIGKDQFAYKLRAEFEAGEPAHALCANCYDSGQKSILQTETRNPGRRKVHFCQRCKGDLYSSSTGGRTA